MRFLIFLLAGCATAQTPDSRLTFEVASVKVTGDADAGRTSFTKNGANASPPGSDPILFTRRRATLSSLLMAAYGLSGQQIIGPDWLTTAQYDILARVPNGATAAQQLVMLQDLLAERFGVMQHRETRDLPVYEMVVAKGGPKLIAPGTVTLRAMTADGPIALTRLGARLRGRATLETLAARLSHVADRLILDCTGLKGEYDIDLLWSDQPASTSTPDVASDPGTGLGLAKALESQLGLRLNAKKDPVEVLVVDRARKIPTEN